MKRLLAVAGVMAVFSSLVVPNALPQTYEYDWQGGQSGWSGKVFFDAPSSALAPHAGAISDVLPGSYVTTPFGTFSIMDATAQQDFAPFNFIWDQSQVDLMDLFLDPPTPMILPGYSAPAVANAVAVLPDSRYSIAVGALQNGGYLLLNNYGDATGHWLAVPEPSAASLTICGAALALLAHHSRRHSAGKMPINANDKALTSFIRPS